MYVVEVINDRVKKQFYRHRVKTRFLSDTPVEIRIKMQFPMVILKNPYRCSYFIDKKIKKKKKSVKIQYYVYSVCVCSKQYYVEMISNFLILL